MTTDEVTVPHESDSTPDGAGEVRSSTWDRSRRGRSGRIQRHGVDAYQQRDVDPARSGDAH